MPVRQPTWKVIPFLILAMPLVWGLGYLLARYYGCDPTMACWRSTVMTLSWPVGSVIYLLINGGVAWSQGEGMLIMLLIHHNMHMPKRVPQQFADVLGEGLRSALVLGVFFGLSYRLIRFVGGRWQARREHRKPNGPGLDPDV